MMKTMNWTQVPLCHEHHKMVHRNGLMAMLKDHKAQNEEDLIQV